MKELKLLTVGNTAVGKTSQFTRLTTDDFSEEWKPKFFYSWSQEYTVDSETYCFGFWDSVAEPEYDHSRPLSYPQTDVVLLCFSSIDRVSMNEIKEKWIPELKEHGIDRVGYVIVQTKCDLYEHRRVKNIPIILNSFLRKFEDWMPSELFRLLLQFADYPSDPVPFDPDIEAALIPEEEIDALVRTDWKFGLWKKSERAPFIRTSALSGTNISNGALVNLIAQCFETHQQNQQQKKKRKCLVM